MKVTKIVPLFAIFFLVSCVPSLTPTSESELEIKKLGSSSTNGAVSREEMVRAYTNTVYPIVRANCVACHGDAKLYAPFFAVSDPGSAWDNISRAFKIDLSNPALSRVVQRLGTDNHNCWSDCGENSTQMLDAVERLASSISSAGPVGISTGTLRFTDAVTRRAQTENGILMLQAESGILSGRFEIGQSAGASGGKYISGPAAPNNPIENTPRTVTIANNGSCNPPSASELSSKTGGQVRYSESVRHINSNLSATESNFQDGYRPYSMEVRVRIVRPDKRKEYAAALARGINDISEVENFLLKDGSWTNSATAAQRNTSGLDGNRRTTSMMRVLPDLADHSDIFSGNNFIQNAALYDFFAPRFGATNTEYFTTTQSDLRNRLSATYKQKVLFRQVSQFFYNQYYEGNGSLRALNRINTPLLRLISYGDVLSDSLSITHSDATPTSPAINIDGGAVNLTYDNADDLITVSDGTNSRQVHRIDTYVHYYVDTTSRNFNDFTVSLRASDGSVESSQSYNIGQGNITLNRDYLFAGSSRPDPRTVYAENYRDTVMATLNNYVCATCHAGQNGGAPAFLSSDYSAAYSIIAANNYVDFDTPRASFRAVGNASANMYHNCASGCENLHSEVVSAINQWKLDNDNDLAAADSGNTYSNLTAAQRTPGRAQFPITITEDGYYNVWIKVLEDVNNADSFRIRILDNNGSIVRSGRGRSAGNTNCQTYTYAAPTWTWYTPNRDNEDDNQRTFWQLSAGDYTLEIIENEAQAKIDLVAISSNIEFDPYNYAIGENYISDLSPNVLTYDLSSIVGEPVSFSIEVKEDLLQEGSYQNYTFRNPRFRIGNTNLRVNGIKALINEAYTASNATFNNLNKVIGERYNTSLNTNDTILTYAPLTALQVAGPAVDTFSFSFNSVELTGDTADKVEDDPVVAGDVMRECQELTFFSNVVKPILNKFRLVYKDDMGYEEYLGDFPGRRRQGANSPQFFNCTTCHNEDHPYFKMTTFFDPNSNAADRDKILCKEALSRVDFSNPKRSLIVRGIYGSDDHPKLHFIEDARNYYNSGSRMFNTDSNKATGMASDWLPTKFATYSRADLSLDSTSGDDTTAEAYRRQFVGEYKRAVYVRHNNPLAFDVFGEIRTSDDVDGDPNAVDGMGNPAPIPDNYPGNGTNLYNVLNIGSYNNSTLPLSDFDPQRGSDWGPIIIDNSGPDNPDFETLKFYYRDKVLEWINREATHL